jgi:uncharacterized Zn finger protein (UPF0148 family)
MKDLAKLLAFLVTHNINYRQLTKSKLEIYTKSCHYDKVFFFTKTGKLHCTTWDNIVIKKIETEEELLETILTLTRGLEICKSN